MDHTEFASTVSGSRWISETVGAALRARFSTFAPAVGARFRFVLAPGILAALLCALFSSRAGFDRPCEVLRRQNDLAPPTAPKSTRF